MGGLPIEWGFSVETSGVAQIIIPAGGPTVRRVLTYLEASVLNIALGGATPTVQVFDGATLVFSRTLRTFAGAGAEDLNSFAMDLTRVGTPATTMTIQFSGAVSLEFLAVKGFDI